MGYYMKQLFIGIDVSKLTLDIFISEIDFELKISNNEVGLGKLEKTIKRLQKQGYEIKLVGFEATGGYEKTLRNRLEKLDWSYDVVHPNKVRNFCRAKGKFAKTDKLDARMIAEYTRLLGERKNRELQSDNLNYLKELNQRRTQLIDEKVRESNRLEKSPSKYTEISIREHMEWLEKEIEKIEEEKNEIVKEDPKIKEDMQLMTSIGGVGKITAMAVITDLSDIKEGATKKEIASLIGLAPMNRDSGTISKSRHIYGGRGKIRKVLYMAALAAIRGNRNKIIRDFYHKLRSKGKVFKVAIVACMHKLLEMILIVLKRRSGWQETI